MKRLKEIAKKVKDGHGWLSMSEHKRLKVVDSIVKVVMKGSERADRDWNTVAALYTSFFAGKLTFFYRDPDTNEGRNLDVPFESAIAYTVNVLNNEIKEAQASQKATIH
jgi:hypothetical protein